MSKSLPKSRCVYKRSRDANGNIVKAAEKIKKKQAFIQARWSGSIKMYNAKAGLPGDQGVGILRIYAGKRGEMHSIQKHSPIPWLSLIP